MSEEPVQRILQRMRKHGETWYKVERRDGCGWEREEDLQEDGCWWMMDAFNKQRRAEVQSKKLGVGKDGGKGREDPEDERVRLAKHRNNLETVFKKEMEEEKLAKWMQTYEEAKKDKKEKKKKMESAPDPPLIDSTDLQHILEASHIAKYADPEDLWTDWEHELKTNGLLNSDTEILRAYNILRADKAQLIKDSWRPSEPQMTIHHTGARTPPEIVDIINSGKWPSKFRGGRIFGNPPFYVICAAPKPSPENANTPSEDIPVLLLYTRTNRNSEDIIPCKFHYYRRLPTDLEQHFAQ